MEFKELKWYVKLLVIAMLIVLLPVIILGFAMFFIMLIVPSPIEIIVYKKSHYYKKFNRKYHFGITYSIDFSVTNKIVKDSILIDIVFNKEKEFTYLKKNNTIFLFYWFETIIFDEENQKWQVAETNNDELLDIDSAIIEEKNKLLDSDKDLPVVVLLKKKEIKKTELALAKLDNRFLIFTSVNSLIESVYSYNGEK